MWIIPIKQSNVLEQNDYINDFEPCVAYYEGRNMKISIQINKQLKVLIFLIKDSSYYFNIKYVFFFKLFSYWSLN